MRKQVQRVPAQRWRAPAWSTTLACAQECAFVVALNCRGAQALLKPGELARSGGGGSLAEGAGRRESMQLHQSLTEGVDSINQVVE